MEPAIGHREGRLGYHAWKRYTEFGSCERLRRKAWQLDLKTRPPIGLRRGLMTGRNRVIIMLSNTAVRSASFQRLPGRGIRRIPINWGITSVATMMLAADRIAANVLAANLKTPCREGS